MTEKAFKSDDSVGYRHEIIPPDRAEDCPYLERWLLGVGVPGRSAWFTIRLHHFFRSDEDHLHDHPFWFITLVLKGFYEDWVECPWCKLRHRIRSDCECGGSGQIVGTRMTPGKVRFRLALHQHRVVTDGVWTLVLSGPKVRDWGFYTPDGWLRQRAYFRKYGGSAACD